MSRRSSLRASDSDREQIADRLRNATAEGRLLAEELEERLGAALSARTYGELDALVADLPGGQLAARRPAPVRPLVIRGAAVAVAVVAVMAVVAMAVLVITGLFAIWLVWAAIGWWLFGQRRRRRYYAGPPRRI